MDEIIKKILNKIKKNQQDSIVFNQKDKKSEEIKKEKFHDIPREKNQKKIAFVDGGNLEILRSPSLSLFFNRIYYTIYKNNKRIQNNLVEFYTLINATEKNNKLFFSTEYFFTKNKINLKKYEFDSFDKTLVSGNRRAKISLIGNIIRRFAELSIINNIESDIVVIDGSLEPKYVYEKEAIENINKDKVVCGLSKTTELLTKKGSSVSAFLNKLSEKKTWYYSAKEFFFIKLHENTKYVFRLDMMQKNKIDGVLYLLKENSKDPIFLGYPYGLIEADRFARVSKNQKKILQLELEMKLKKDFRELLPYLAATDAHDILDNIS